MATRSSKKVNQFYVLYATEHLVIDEDEQGLYCEVISESDLTKTHRVHVDETTVVPVATHCSCKSHEHSGNCKHCEIVDGFYVKVYKSNLEKFVAKFEQEETEQVEETPVAMDLPAELQGSGKVLSVPQGNGSEMLRGNLNGAQRSAGFLAILPSRQKIA